MGDRGPSIGVLATIRVRRQVTFRDLGLIFSGMETPRVPRINLNLVKMLGDKSGSTGTYVNR